jgi:hypothetical protein
VRCQGAKQAKGEAARDDGPRLRVAGSFAGFRTTLVFDGGERVGLEQLAASASLEWYASRRWTLMAAAGGTFAGSLGTERLGAGGVGSVAGSFLALDQGAWWPFVQLSLALSVSGAAAPESAYLAVDARAALVVGYTFRQRVTPYAVARAFGGPAFYAGRTGTDLYHAQVGAGLVVGLPGGFDLSAEVVPLGEQRFTAAVGFSF